MELIASSQASPCSSLLWDWRALETSMNTHAKPCAEPPTLSRPQCASHRSMAWPYPCWLLHSHPFSPPAISCTAVRLPGTTGLCNPHPALWIPSSSVILSSFEVTVAFPSCASLMVPLAPSRRKQALASDTQQIDTNFQNLPYPDDLLLSLAGSSPALLKAVPFCSLPPPHSLFSTPCSHPTSPVAPSPPSAPRQSGTAPRTQQYSLAG